MLGCLLVVLACAAEERCHGARIALEGPLERVELELGASRTTLALRLLTGERRMLEVPLGERPLDPDARPALVATGAGAARFDGWLEPPAPLPAVLVARPRAPLRARGARPAWPALVLCAGALVLTFGLWRRRTSAALAALLGAAAALGLQARAGSAPAESVRVLEGRGADWIVVDTGVSALALAPGAFPRVASEPSAAPLEWVVTPEAWTARARGARLHALAPLAPGTRSLAPELNTWGPLDAVWVRAAQGTWTVHGPWALGAPLPTGAAGPGPPGWLAAGLPQGRRALVARLARDTWCGPLPPGGAPERAWLRYVAD
jgi:hypothetical protein